MRSTKSVFRMLLLIAIFAISSAFVNAEGLSGEKMNELLSLSRLSAADSAGLVRSNFQFNLNGSGGNTQVGALNFNNVVDSNGKAELRSMSFKGDKFSVSATASRVDSDFTALGVTGDKDINKFLGLKDTRQFNLNADMKVAKGLALTSSYSSVDKLSSDQSSRSFSNKLSFDTSGGPKLSFAHTQATSGSGGSESDTVRQTMSLSHTVGSISLSAVQDNLSQSNSAGTESSVNTRSMHFNTDRSRKTSLSGDWTNVSRSDGSFQNSQNFNLSSKISPSLSFNGTRGVSVTGSGAVSTQDYLFTGRLTDGVGFTGKWNDVSTNGAVTSAISELSLSPTRAAEFGAFKKVLWGVKVNNTMASLTETRVNTVNASSEVAGHLVTVEHKNSTWSSGKAGSTEALGIAGSAGDALKYTLGMKMRDMNDEDAASIFSVDVKYTLNPDMTLSYAYTSGRENADGTFNQVQQSRIRLDGRIAGGLNMVTTWENTSDRISNADTTKYSVGLSGKVSNGATFEAAYGYGGVSGPSAGSSNSYTVKYNRRLDTNHYLVFSGDFLCSSGSWPVDPNVDNTVFRVDFRTIFE